MDIGHSHNSQVTRRRAPARTAKSIDPKPVLILRRSEIAALMNSAAYLAAVEEAFRSHARGAAIVPLPMHIPVADGGFHAKGASITLDRVYAAVKVNGNFPGNRERSGLPTIQGVVLLFEAVHGSLLAVMDSIEITAQRTAAASALAARYLAREDSRSIAICGCGDQGRAHLLALAQVVSLKTALVWDIQFQKARRFARAMQSELGLEVNAVRHVQDATLPSDIIVTATSAETPFVTPSCVSPGTFIAAVGADSPRKSELAPELLAGSKVVVDILAQALTMGDLHHAVDSGKVAPADVHGELGELVSGRKPGRTSAGEITIFDSTGTAIQDVASAAWVYQRAIARKSGTFAPIGT